MASPTKVKIEDHFRLQSSSDSMTCTEKNKPFSLNGRFYQPLTTLTFFLAGE